jgi:hypothetical protein
MKARTNWWVDYYEDEPQWVGNLIITMPDGQTIEFSYGWETKEEATNWCALLDEQLDAVGVEIHEDALPLREEVVITSMNKHRQALEALLRLAYATLPTNLRGRAEELLKSTEGVVESVNTP